MKKEYIIPIFVPHLGCPNKCTFCNQKKISGQMKNVTAQDVKNTIEYYLKNFKDNNKYVEVAFFGGSFTGIDEEIQNELLQAANIYIEQGKVNSIRISTRPDYINKEILKRLKKYHVKTIELGVQSTNDYILAKSQRGHTFEDVKKASKLIRRYGFTLGHQMMIGLPESTKLDEINAAKDLIKLKPKIVRIYPVLVIKDTTLAEEYEKGEYIPLTVEQAVERSKEVVTLFNNANVNVIRIGLQNTEEINDPSSNQSQVVAGPYHPAFRELVEGEMIKDYLHYLVIQNKTVSSIEIKTNNKNISKVVGNKKSNKLFFKNELNINMKIKPENLEENEFIIILDDNKEINIKSEEMYKELYNIYNL